MGIQKPIIVITFKIRSQCREKPSMYPFPAGEAGTKQVCKRKPLQFRVVSETHEELP